MIAIASDIGSWSEWLDVLEKAYHAHRRAPKGGIADVRTEGRRYKGGQFIDTATWQAEKAAAEESLAGLISEFGEGLQFLRAMYEQQTALMAEGKTAVKLVPLTSVEARMKTEIRNAYARAFILGKRAAGNFTGATAAEQKAVMGVRRDEYRYLRRFLGDMRTGGGVMPYEKRMDMYAAAARELYWLGWVLGDQRQGRLITWHLGDTREHCTDCVRFTAHGPYDVAEFIRVVLGEGYLPQSGHLECIGYWCKCFLTESFTAPLNPDGTEPERAARAKTEGPGTTTAAPEPELELEQPTAEPEPERSQQKRSRQPRLRIALPPKAPKQEGETLYVAPSTLPQDEKPIANVMRPLGLRPIKQERIALLGLRPELWIRLDRQKVRTIGQLMKLTQGDLLAMGIKPEDVRTIRNALKLVGAEE